MEDLLAGRLCADRLDQRLAERLTELDVLDDRGVEPGPGEVLDPGEAECLSGGENAAGDRVGDAEIDGRDAGADGDEIDPPPRQLATREPDELALEGDREPDPPARFGSEVEEGLEVGRFRPSGARARKAE